MRRLLVAAVVCGLLVAGMSRAPTAEALPHGCASVSRDYSVAAEPMARRAAVKVHTDEPCTFLYGEGDTFSGAGRFTVTCSTGGRYYNEDFQGGEYPPVVGVPVPQPCDVGATVTLDGYHQFTGGLVIGGGLSGAPAAPSPRSFGDDFHHLCAGAERGAVVDLQEPVNYSGLLTYSGTVVCEGATVEIASLTITPLAGFGHPSAGTARCKRCKGPVSVSGTVPAKAWLYEVEMRFEVTARGQAPVSATRLGRYAVTWAGTVTTVCPGIRPWASPDAPDIHVPAGETCPI